MFLFITNPDASIDLYAVLNLFGTVQGIILAYFFTNKNHRQIPSNLYIGLLLLSASIISFDSFLCYTNYMFYVIRLNDFSEPLALLIGPYFYFYIYSKLLRHKPSKTWPHYLPALAYFLYMIPFHIADESVKYNAYINAYHPDLEFKKLGTGFNFNDFLNLHDSINEIIAISFIIYGLMALVYFIKSRQMVDLKTQRLLKISIGFYGSILLMFFIVKLIFKNDLGDYILNSSTAILIYSIGINYLRQSIGFKSSTEKYQKSSLDENFKDRLLQKIKKEMEIKQYYLNPNASLPDLANQIDSNSNHVSQVINECLKMNYFEMIATYRIEHAKRLISDKKTKLFTIEEIAATVGYLSKSAFNKSFKKVTGLTPSEFREQL